MRKVSIGTFIFAAFVALAYAIYTDHRWEDWYITFRASKNFALGEGLTFTKGERVYSYTSPIGTLLPALFAWLAPRSNQDEWALWLYRAANISMLGFAAVWLLKLAQVLRLDRLNTVLLLALFVFNSLIIDNAINGMETPWMLFFLVLLMYNLARGEAATRMTYAIAFTGLMYTRPDGFVYAGCLIGGFGLSRFNFRKPSELLPFLRPIALAAAISLALYLPWIIATWWYYGSPIPNTILAKANLRDYGLGIMLLHLVKMPYYLINGVACTSYFFMPAYAVAGGWAGLGVVGRWVCTAAVFCLAVPPLPRAVRALAISAGLGIFYLSFLSGQGPMPWYLPNVAIQFCVLICCVNQYLVTRFGRAWLQYPAIAFAGLNLCILLLAAHEFEVQQKVIEFGNRKAVGLWLKDHARPEQSAFVECLGNIGFYSEMKMYDYPGMSSPEVVRTIKDLKSKKLPFGFAGVIARLRPDWVVLRPLEIASVIKDNPTLLRQSYTQVKVFDVRSDIPKDPLLPGKPYMNFDAVFEVYRKKGS